jgi:hypothetical protein
MSPIRTSLRVDIEAALRCAALEPALRSILIFDAGSDGLRAIAERLASMI